MATVREARKSDLKDVEYVCRMTAGNLARTNDIIGEATAKTYSSYYIRECTDTCFVLADDKDVAVGYVLCEPDFKRFAKIFPKVDVPIISKIYKRDGRRARLIPFPYCIFGRKYPAHLHIDILPEYQGKGYGSLMMEALLQKLSSTKVKGIMLTADSDNYGAIRFYKRFGFHTVISIKNAGIVMAKNISK